MTLKQEIAELCQAIFTFETEMAPIKEELFNLPIVTRQLVWNHAFGQKYTKVDASQLTRFFVKHGLSVSANDADLIMQSYSSDKDATLRVNDFWQIFKPLTVKFIEQVNDSRENRSVLANCHEAHYKISDLLCSIMQKTIQFLRSCQKMKRNIADAQPEKMIIEPLDPAHFQMYINQFAPTLLRKDVELVFKHIMRNQLVCLKTFKEYFIPAAFKRGSVNPNCLVDLSEPAEMEGLELTKYHFANVNYVRSDIKRRPLYLSSGTAASKLAFYNQQV